MTIEPTKKPGRGIATVLGVLGPMGTGHLYLGQTRRALSWLLVPSAGVILFASMIGLLGGTVGYGVLFAALVVLGIGAWVGSLIDLHRLPAASLRPVPVWQIIAFFVGGMFFTSAVRSYIRTSVLEAFKISSSSMQPALLAGDHLFVDKSLNTRSPKRGTIIVFKSPEHPDQSFVMRAIAIGGDRLEVKQGHPWLNGWEIPHCLVGTKKLPTGDGTASGPAEVWLETLDGTSYLTLLADGPIVAASEGPYAVKPGEAFVLGDDRNRSFDSRRWFAGAGSALPSANIVGRALFRWMSDNDGAMDFSRYGKGFDQPLLPASMADLRPGLDKCMSERPAQSSPPAS